jgi:hypothetical protein
MNGTNIRSGEVDRADLPVDADIGGGHQPVVDTEVEDQENLGDEHDAEKEHQPTQRFLSGTLEALEIDAVDRRPSGEEQGRDRHPDEDRIDPPGAVDDVGNVCPDHHEGRMRDVDDVELAEDDRQAERHRRVEPAEQQARHDRVGEQLRRKDHGLSPRCPTSPL